MTGHPNPRYYDQVNMSKILYDRLITVFEAARAVVASEATRHDETIPAEEWLSTNVAARKALTAAVNALEATDG